MFEPTIRIPVKERTPSGPAGPWPGHALVAAGALGHPLLPAVDHSEKLEAGAVQLFEPATTLNTGNVIEARTVRRPERI